AILALLPQTAQAQDALGFFKNWFVTGDYVAAGIGLRGQGQYHADPCADQASAAKAKGQNLSVVPCGTRSTTNFAGNFAQNVITVSGLPVSPINGTYVPADIVAAFLYWQADEPASPTTNDAPMARSGVFDGNPIVGAVVGDRLNPACDTSTGARYGRVYRADVRKYLAYNVDTKNKTDASKNTGANGIHWVSLADRGSATSGPIVNGASLVIVYRVLVPGKPL